MIPPRDENGHFLRTQSFTDEEVVALIDSGHTTTQIADRLFSSSETVLKITHKYKRSPNLPPKFWNDTNRQMLRDLWAEVPKLTTPEMGRRLGANKNMVLGEARRMGLPTRDAPSSRRELPEVRERAVQLLKNGLPPSQVALMVGIKLKTAQEMRKRLGLPPLAMRCNRTHKRRPAVRPSQPREKPVSRLPMPPRAIEMSLFQTVAYVAAPIVIIKAPSGPGKRCEWLDGDRPHFVQCTEPVTSFRDDGSYIDLAHQVWCCGHRRRVFRPRQVLEVAA